MTRRYLLPLLFLLTAPAFAQTDSLQISHSTEPPDSSEFRWRERYRYLTRANVEEKTLVKLGFGPMAGVGGYNGYFIQLNNEVLIERKLRPAWSVLGGVNFGMGYQSPGYVISTSDKRNFSLPTYLAARVGFRNYYSIARRIRNRKSANNFSNNYWGAEVWVPIMAHSWVRSPVLMKLPDGTYSQSEQRDWQFTHWGGRVQPQIYWGIQRRIGRRGYLDFNLSARYNSEVIPRFSARPQPFDPLTTLPHSEPLLTVRRFQIHPTLRIGLGW